MTDEQGAQQQQKKPASKDMTLRIQACRQVYAGVNPRGDRYTIFEVDAVTQSGVEIREPDGTSAKLRAFEPLPVGQLVEVTVSVFHSERHGKSYTLSRRGHGGGPTTSEQVANLAEKVKELEGKVGSLTNVVRGLLDAQQHAPTDAQLEAATQSVTFEDAPPSDGLNW
jgi:hypothetical protein